MPHTKHRKKSLRQNEVRRLHNRSIRSDLRTAIKKLLKSVEQKDEESAHQQLRIVHKKLDKCGARRYIHPNTASRQKSRLTKQVAQISAE